MEIDVIHRCLHENPTILGTNVLGLKVFVCLKKISDPSLHHTHMLQIIQTSALFKMTKHIANVICLMWNVISRLQAFVFLLENFREVLITSLCNILDILDIHKCKYFLAIIVNFDLFIWYSLHIQSSHPLCYISRRCCTIWWSRLT